MSSGHSVVVNESPFLKPTSASPEHLSKFENLHRLTCKVDLRRAAQTCWESQAKLFPIDLLPNYASKSATTPNAAAVIFPRKRATSRNHLVTNDWG